MEDEERAFIEYFNEIAKRIKEQGSEVYIIYRRYNARFSISIISIIGMVLHHNL